MGEKIWSDSKTHNSQAPWNEKLSKEYEAPKEQEWSEITLEDLKHALKKSSKWKSPEKDKIPNFWINTFHETQTRLTQLYNLVITDSKQIPQCSSTASPTNCLKLMRLIIPKTIVLLPVLPQCNKS